MEHDLVRMVRCHTAVTLAPVVADRVRKDRAGTVERRARHGTRRGVERLEPSARILIPKVDRAVRTTRREGAVYGMKGDVVHGVHEGLVLGRGVLVTSVTLEREVVANRIC